LRRYDDELRTIVETTHKRWKESLSAGKGVPDMLKECYILGEPLPKTSIQLRNTVDFVAKKAIIITQSDYSLTRLVDTRLGNLPATKNDAVDAKEIAHGFGIIDDDILEIEDMPVN
jgi:hypothetical protein